MTTEVKTTENSNVTSTSIIVNEKTAVTEDKYFLKYGFSDYSLINCFSDDIVVFGKKGPRDTQMARHFQQIVKQQNILGFAVAGVMLLFCSCMCCKMTTENFNYQKKIKNEAIDANRVVHIETCLCCMTNVILENKPFEVDVMFVQGVVNIQGMHSPGQIAQFGQQGGQQQGGQMMGNTSTASDANIAMLTAAQIRRDQDKQDEIAEEKRRERAAERERERRHEAEMERLRLEAEKEKLRLEALKLKNAKIEE
jgi:hypothetical protein